MGVRSSKTAAHGKEAEQEVVSLEVVQPSRRADNFQPNHCNPGGVAMSAGLGWMEFDLPFDLSGDVTVKCLCASMGGREYWLKVYNRDKLSSNAVSVLWVNQSFNTGGWCQEDAQMVERVLSVGGMKGVRTLRWEDKNGVGSPHLFSSASVCQQMYGRSSPSKKAVHSEEDEEVASLEVLQPTRRADNFQPWNGGVAMAGRSGWMEFDMPADLSGDVTVKCLCASAGGREYWLKAYNRDKPPDNAVSVLWCAESFNTGGFHRENTQMVERVLSVGGMKGVRTLRWEDKNDIGSPHLFGSASVCQQVHTGASATDFYPKMTAAVVRNPLEQGKSIVYALPGSEGKYFYMINPQGMGDDKAKKKTVREKLHASFLADKSGKTLPTNIKLGEGTVIRAFNSRTSPNASHRGALLWPWNLPDGSSSYIGCWNPAEFAVKEDWCDGDELRDLDAPSGAAASASLGGSATRVVLVSSCVEGSGSGWNNGGEKLAFGECGLVGGWWKELEVSFKFDGPWTLSAVRTDSSEVLPFALDVKYNSDGSKWLEAASELRGPLAKIGPLYDVISARLRWSSTDMHQLEGLSTARSGGGIHAEFWGATAAGATKAVVKGAYLSQADTEQNAGEISGQGLSQSDSKREREDGLVRLTIRHAVTWEEARAQAEREAGGLPTCDELRKACVVDVAGGVDLWMPVQRSDGRQGDYCQVGNSSGGHKTYISHIDTHYVPGWGNNTSPTGFRPGPSAHSCKGYFFARAPSGGAASGGAGGGQISEKIGVDVSQGAMMMGSGSSKTAAHDEEAEEVASLEVLQPTRRAGNFQPWNGGVAMSGRSGWMEFDMPADLSGDVTVKCLCASAGGREYWLKAYNRDKPSDNAVSLLWCAESFNTGGFHRENTQMVERVLSVGGMKGVRTLRWEDKNDIGSPHLFGSASVCQQVHERSAGEYGAEEMNKMMGGGSSKTAYDGEENEEEEVTSLEVVQPTRHADNFQPNHCNPGGVAMDGYYGWIEFDMPADLSGDVAVKCLCATMGGREYWLTAYNRDKPWSGNAVSVLWVNQSFNTGGWCQEDAQIVERVLSVGEMKGVRTLRWEDKNGVGSPHLFSSASVCQQVHERSAGGYGAEEGTPVSSQSNAPFLLASDVCDGEPAEEAVQAVVVGVVVDGSDIGVQGPYAAYWNAHRPVL